MSEEDSVPSQQQTRLLSPPPQPPNPNPNNQPPSSRPSSAPMTEAPNTGGRLHPQGFPRTTWQHPHFSPFSSSTSSSPAPSLPSSAPVAVSSPRASGGMAIGVPASSFGQQHFGALARGGSAGLSEPVSAAGSSQARPGMQVIGSMNSGPQIRPGMVANPRPIQSGMRSSPSASSTPSPAPQSFQGHGFAQFPSGGPSASSSAPSNAAKGMPAPRQPWMAAAPQGAPPLPVPSHRPQMTSSQGHPRSITAQLQQQRQSLSSTPQRQQQQHTVSSQTQPALPSSHQPPEHPGHHFPPSKLPQASPKQQQVVRVQGSASQKQASPATMQANTVNLIVQNKANMESDESGTRVLSKRTIHELVSQIDPLERLDPDVEDILTDIADDFVDSVSSLSHDPSIGVLRWSSGHTAVCTRYRSAVG